MDLLKKLLEANRSEQIYQVSKLSANVSTGVSVVKSIIGSIVFILVGAAFIFWAKVYLMGFIFLVFGILIPILTYNQRRKQMEFLNLSAQTTTQEKTEFTPQVSDEIIVDYIAGVMATGMHAVTFVLGSAGMLAAPENSIVLTNKNVWFVYVPLPGADVITQTTDIASTDFMFAQKNIDDKLKNIIQQGGIAALVATSKKNFSIPLTKLRQVSFSLMGNIVFSDAEGKTFSYGIRRQEDKEKSKKMFNAYIPK